MEWSTVAFFGICVLAILGAAYLVLAFLAYRRAVRMQDRISEQMDEDRRRR